MTTTPFIDHGGVTHGQPVAHPQAVPSSAMRHAVSLTWLTPRLVPPLVVQLFKSPCIGGGLRGGAKALDRNIRQQMENPMLEVCEYQRLRAHLVRARRLCR